MWKNLGDLIDHSKAGEAIALVDCGRGDVPMHYSYSQLDARIRACARCCGGPNNPNQPSFESLKI